MTHRSRCPLAAALGLTLLTAGCADHQAPTAPGASLTTPTLARASASGSGATVERSTFPFGFVGVDPAAGLAWFVGPLDPVEAVDIKCPDPSVIAPVSPGAQSKIVTTPNGRVQIRGITREAHVAVWQFTGPLTSLCQLVGAPVVATGVVHYTVTITNTNVLDGLPGGPGAAVQHTTAVGVVDLSGGGQARLHASARIVVLPDGTLRADEERIRLTPLRA
jgi:hypothetical protein